VLTIRPFKTHIHDIWRKHRTQHNEKLFVTKWKNKFHTILMAAFCKVKLLWHLELHKIKAFRYLPDFVLQPVVQRTWTSENTWWASWDLKRYRFYSNTYETIPIFNDSDSDSFNMNSAKVLLKNTIFSFSNEYFQLWNNWFYFEIIINYFKQARKSTVNILICKSHCGSFTSECVPSCWKHPFEGHTAIIFYLIPIL